MALNLISFQTSENKLSVEQITQNTCRDIFCDIKI